jgi:hypothetical protein
VLAELYPELPRLPAWRSGDRQLRFLPPPPDFARHRPERPYPVAVLVFPRYQPQAELELQPLDPVAVLGCVDVHLSLILCEKISIATLPLAKFTNYFI